MEACCLVAALECAESVFGFLPRGIDNCNFIRICHRDLACLLCNERVTRGPGSNTFHSGTHERSLWPDEWNRLPQHVRAHGGTSVIVVLQERDERCADREDLLWGDIHVGQILHVCDERLACKTCGNPAFDDLSSFVNDAACLCCRDVALLLCIHVRRFPCEVGANRNFLPPLFL